METAAQAISCIRYEDLAYGTLHSFATYSSKNGHNGTSGLAFYQDEYVVTDIAWTTILPLIHLISSLTSISQSIPIKLICGPA